MAKSLLKNIGKRELTADSRPLRVSELVELSRRRDSMLRMNEDLTDFRGDFPAVVNVRVNVFSP